MVTHFDLPAGQNYFTNYPYDPKQNTYDPVLWDTTRHFESGNVKVNLTDIHITVTAPTGYVRVINFDWVDYQVGVYRRGGANSGIVALKTIRRYWGQGDNWVTLGSVPDGTYSLRTWPVRHSGEGMPGVGWCQATFDLYHQPPA